MQKGSARARRGPSEARLKFFGETFLQKSFDLALDLHRRAAQERKLGKQRSAFPGRRSASAVNSRPSAWALNSRPWQLAAARAHREGSARARRGQLEKPPPLTNAAERGTIEIEKESLPVRRLAQVMKLLYEKVAAILGRGRLLFRVLNVRYNHRNQYS